MLSLYNFPFDAVIGGDGNEVTFLRGGYDVSNDVAADTPNVLSADNYQLFTLRLDLDGTLAVYQGYNLDTPIASYGYGTSHAVNYFGIR